MYWNGLGDETARCGVGRGLAGRGGVVPGGWQGLKPSAETQTVASIT